MKTPPSKLLVASAALLLAGCSSPHRLAGVWQLDRPLERKTIETYASLDDAAKVPYNPALADAITISFTKHKIAWVIEGGGERYIEYNFTIKTADAQSVSVVEQDPVTGASRDMVYHFEPVEGQEAMWTSDPAVDKAMGKELKLYFRPAR